MVMYITHCFLWFMLSLCHLSHINNHKRLYQVSCRKGRKINGIHWSNRWCDISLFLLVFPFPFVFALRSAWSGLIMIFHDDSCRQKSRKVRACLYARYSFIVDSSIMSHARKLLFIEFIQSVGKIVQACLYAIYVNHKGLNWTSDDRTRT